MSCCKYVCQNWQTKTDNLATYWYINYLENLQIVVVGDEIYITHALADT